MSKGNKETKKPKKVRVPNAPALPENLLSQAASPQRPKKR